MTGGAIAGARLRVTFLELAFARSRSTGRFDSKAAPDAEWVTDAEGASRGFVPSGRVELEALAEAYAETSKVVQAPAQNISLTLAPGATISGRVQLADGTPVAGARIQVVGRALLQLESPLETTSDARGEFAFNGVSAGVFEINVLAQGLSRARQSLSLGVAEATPPVVLTIEAAHSVLGSVRVAGGAPCLARVVYLMGQAGGAAPVDAEGHYRVDGLGEGTHLLGASCSEAAAQRRTLEIGANSLASVTLDSELGVGLTLAGSVRWRDGQPMPDTPVWVTPVQPPDGAAESEPLRYGLRRRAARMRRAHSTVVGWSPVGIGRTPPLRQAPTVWARRRCGSPRSPMSA